MNTVDFIRKARELTDALERFYITRSRLCAVTLHSGDGICVAFDRSDRPAAKLHQYMHSAFPEDNYILSYEPSRSIYRELSPCADSVIEDPEALRQAVLRFKSHLYSVTGERYFSSSTDKAIHIVFTEHGVIAGGVSLKRLEDSVFRTEELVKTMEILSHIRSTTLSEVGDSARDMADKLRAMEMGQIYIRDRKNKNLK